MKALYIFLGAWILLTGICTLTGYIEMDQITAGMYVTALGLITITGGFGGWRNK